MTSGVYKIQPGGDVIVGEGVQLHHLSSVGSKHKANSSIFTHFVLFLGNSKRISKVLC